MDLRIFLAHDKSDADSDIDKWRATIEEQLLAATEGTDIENVTVTAGRDDYNHRSKEAGGWRAWSESIVTGTTWDGEMLFHQLVRPVKFISRQGETVGRPTFEMFENSLGLGKDCYVWSANDQSFHKVEVAERMPGDDYKHWGRLVTAKEQR